RAQLAEFLLESLRDASDAEIKAAWDREIEERVAAYDRGELKTFSSEDVFAEARRLAR
ncbi:MAG: addiction module protein, partial [Nitrospirota bacterium]|nr:addiction module protein [Nitrospirota bacterium]